MPRWILWTLGVVAALLLLAVLAIAAFPIGMLKGTAETRLSERFGRPVTIGGLERAEPFSFRPMVIVRDVRVPQPAWAGRGDLALLGEVRVRIRTLPLLLGRFSPSRIEARGVRLDLVRAADGRKNWAKPDADQDATGGDAPRLDAIDVRDARIRYRDLKRDRSFAVNAVADRSGVRFAGTGRVRGVPVRIVAQGAPVTDSTMRWPFDVRIAGNGLSMSARGTMDAPLDTDRMTLAMDARASDLKLIDAIIEAGLFGTQPVALTATVRHDGATWDVRDLKGTVGTSDIAGRVTATKADGRTRLDGEMRSARLDFDDLSSDAGQAEARARIAREGLKIVPPTKINLAKIGRTDGRIAFRVDRVFSKRQPSSITGLAGTMTLEQRLLTVDPLTIRLPRGAITGRVTVDQRGDRREPVLTLALDLKGSSVAALAGGGDVSGRLDGVVRLSGTGSTVREAVGRSSGRIGIVARDGALPEKLAAMMGFDAGRALTAGDGRAALRCAIVGIRMRAGRGSFSPLLIDTSASQTRGSGGVTFPTEAIRATLTGAPKGDALLRVPGSAMLAGTLRNPSVTVPPQTRSVGNILKGIGRAITGRGPPKATDADCGALAAGVLR